MLKRGDKVKCIYTYRTGKVMLGEGCLTQFADSVSVRWDPNGDGTKTNYVTPVRDLVKV